MPDFEVNSLYISTQPLMMDGKFHWSLIHVDGDNNATRHHWAQDRATGGPEAYVNTPYAQQALHGFHVQDLGYFRLPEYDFDTMGGVDVIREMGPTIFTETYGTGKRNREHGLNCRTWLWGMLKRLGIQDNRVGEVERAVFERSKRLDEKWVEASLAGKAEEWVPVVEDISL